MSSRKKQPNDASAPEKKPTLRQTYTRTLRALKIWHGLNPRYLPSIILAQLFSALQTYAVIYLSARIVTELSGAREPQALTFWVLLTLGITALLTLCNGLLNRWQSYETRIANQRYPQIYLDRSFTLDYADADDPQVRDLYNQIQQSENYSNYGLYRAIFNFQYLFSGLMMLLGGVVLSVTLFLSPVTAPEMQFLNHPLVSIGVVLLLGLTAVVSPQFTNQASMFDAQLADQARFGNRVFGTFGFSAFDRERSADLRFYNQQENINQKLLWRYPVFFPGGIYAKAAKGREGLLIAATPMTSMLLSGLIYLFVCLKALGGAFGIGAVTQYIGAVTNLFYGLSNLLQSWGFLRANAAFLGTLYDYLDIPSKMYQGSLTTEKRNDRQYEVEFRDVSFHYPGSETDVLHHINLRFHIGSRLAVVGQNGSGKTTFIKLLCRLYDPTEGQILLNGIDIRKYRYDDYLALFSVVFQDFQLIPLTLGENVAASTHYDESRVRKCLEDAGFGERLATLPDGLKTWLYKNMTESGVELSQGEAQKVAIARALYKDAPFIVLDEPTAALDPITEAEIYSHFNSIAGDKTAVYISHRLSSCKFCDEIAVFDHGKIVQQGSHETLLQQEDGKYAQLWHAQAQYYE